MKVLIITSRFFPHGDAQCGVVFSLAEGLKKRGCDVHILALTAYREDESIKEWKGIPVKQVFYAGSMVREEVKAAFSKNAMMGIWALSQIATGMFFRSAYPKYKKLFLNPVTIHVYKKAILRDIKENKYDLCLPTLMPIDAVYSAFSACEKKNVPVGIYQLDTYWNNEMLPFQYQNERFEYEKELIQRSKFSLVLPMIAKSSLKRCPELSKKVICADLPIIKKPEERKQEQNNHNCVYLGTLYPGLRPPEKVVSIISKLHIDKYRFEFYGTRQDLILKSPDYQNASKRIVLHGSVSSQEAEQAREKADILVNIDNTNTTQVPSKLFEYICTGKPIINFYFDPNSAVLDYLARYPLAKNIYLNGDLDESAEMLTEFLNGLDDRRIPFEEIEKVFSENTPDYVANQCIKAYQSTIEPIITRER